MRIPQWSFRRFALALLSLTLVVFVMRNLPWLWAGECPFHGEGSSAPLNHDALRADLARVIDGMRKDELLSTEDDRKRPVGEERINNAQRLRSLSSSTIITTTINHAAATHNFPLFIRSMQLAEPRFDARLVVFCLDEPACAACRRLHSLRPQQCVSMHLGISSASLAPHVRENDQSRLDYFRLTFGRIYPILIAAGFGVNVLPVDVDAVFLQNPFLPGNGLFERPSDIAVVSDVAPFHVDKRDKVPINGGFIFFPTFSPPGVVKQSARFAMEWLQRVWRKNCHPTTNEQLVFSGELRNMHDEYARREPGFRPHMLPADQYLTLCSARCGTELFSEHTQTQQLRTNTPPRAAPTEMQNVRRLEDLVRLSEKHSRNSAFRAQCSRDVAAKRWVYFHTACLNISSVRPEEVTALKAELQRTFFLWAKGVDL